MKVSNSLWMKTALPALSTWIYACPGIICHGWFSLCAQSGNFNQVITAPPRGRQVLCTQSTKPLPLITPFSCPFALLRRCSHTSADRGDACLIPLWCHCNTVQAWKESSDDLEKVPTAVYCLVLCLGNLGLIGSGVPGLRLSWQWHTEAPQDDGETWVPTETSSGRN